MIFNLTGTDAVSDSAYFWSKDEAVVFVKGLEQLIPATHEVIPAFKEVDRYGSTMVKLSFTIELEGSGNGDYLEPDETECDPEDELIPAIQGHFRSVRGS